MVEWPGLRIQLLIGIQYAIYETFGMGVAVAVAFWFSDKYPYLPLVFGGIAVLTAGKHIRRLTKLSDHVEAQAARAEA